MPRTEPSKPLTIQQRKTESARETYKLRSRATRFVDSFLNYFSGFGYKPDRARKRPDKPAAPARSPIVILRELRAFTQHTPRHWRPAGYRPRKQHAVRFHYRRCAP